MGDNCNNNLKESKICYICENEYQYFLNKPNVVGVGLGYKMTKGFYTCEKCIVVFVTRKIPTNYLPVNYLIPTMYKGITTDVVESGVFKTNSLTSKVRPCIPGYVISNVQFDNHSGTLGCLVTDGHNNYILTNNHVIAANNVAPLGSEIIQPCMSCGGNPHTDIIAELTKFIPIKFKGKFFISTNYVDCALGKVKDKSLVSSNIAFVGTPKGVTAPSLNQHVKKVGAMSELTTGIVRVIGSTVVIVAHNVGKSALFKKQIVTSSMVEEGDSGSLLLDVGNNAIGLCMSGTESKATFNPIDLVLKNLGVQLVTD